VSVICQSGRKPCWQRSRMVDHPSDCCNRFGG
jgi:hypothetical protein